MRATPFKIAVPDATLARVRAQVESWSPPPAPADEGPDDWSRGCNTAWLESLRRHWLDAYDWRAVEARLNAIPQFTVEIDGQSIHFLHVRGEAEGRRPLLLTHGWPGSIVEFEDVIGRLAFPSRHGGRAEDAFDPVIPALPGYGFSGAPSKPIGQRATAALWRKLMVEVLGHSRFFAQGGDWGALVTSWLALDHPDVVAGVHLNMLGLRPNPAKPETPEEIAWATRADWAMRMGGAYFMMQATKPQTLALALHDNPMGQAAWIMEKFHGWSDLRGGTLDQVHAKDRLLSNLMFYVLTGRFQTAIWYYRALLEENGGADLPAGRRIETPTGFANYPGETLLPAPPRSWVERAHNVVRWADMPHGGHFAAMEAPDLFVDDLRAFARAVEGR